MNSEEKVIGEVNKNSKEKIRCLFKTYKGKQLFDIRVYYENDEGTWLPTKKGVCFTVDILNDLSNIVQNAVKEIGKKGE